MTRKVISKSTIRYTGSTLDTNFFSFRNIPRVTYLSFCCRSEEIELSKIL